ncbi:unnamed protein product [Phytomonas sp. Hart1]|nr:unnamed protein product [Phytomonas sp. Hart1]|eukprot:CCW69700.1 unnamed protein product [Phytomonas sp. isolate Hart1]
MQQGEAHGASSCSHGAVKEGGVPTVRERDGKGAGVPVGVIQHLLGSSSAAGEPARRFIEVEIETTQGYVYAGKLVDLDAHSNATLQEATVRRERACDVQRALRQAHWRQQRQLMFGMMNRDVALSVLGVDVPEERADSATRMCYVGTTLIRSSSLVMIRFVGDGAVATITNEPVECHSTNNEGRTSRKKSRTEPSSQTSLQRAFVEAATAAKKAVEQERRKNRLERQKRKMEAVKKK